MPESFRTRFLRLRQTADMTQDEIATAMHLRGHARWTYKTVADVEHGRRRRFTPDELIDLAHILDVPVTVLLGVNGRDS